MIIDTNAYVGHWPFRKIFHNTAAELSACAEKCEITHMLVSSVNAVFYKDTMQGNLELADELKDYKGRTKFLPFAVINPTYPEWKNDMTKAVKKLGFKGVELAPAYHGYSLAQEGAEAFKLAGDLNVPVRVLSEFENIRQHHRMDAMTQPSGDEMAAMLSASEKTTAIFNGFYPAFLGPRMHDILADRKNVFFDICRIDTFNAATWEEARDYMSIGHFCFGSLSPFLYIEPNFVKLQFAPCTDAEKEMILSGNIGKYLSLN